MSGLFAGTSLERPVTCERCGKVLDECACPRSASGAVCGPKDQSPRVRREKRRGKWCTVVAGLDADATDLKALLKALRTGLGTGGGITDGELILQGDHRDAVVARLCEMGYRAKPAGG
ncbi:MAG TPA: translation initiation factor [Phycisphaerales bacterium]|nr:translation initiation factor [Phycisphaerales bacterium]